MILRLHDGSEFTVSSLSGANCIVLITGNASETVTLLAKMTDSNLAEYSLTDENKVVTCRNGQLLTMKTSSYNGQWRADYIIKIIADQTDYRSMVQNLTSEVENLQSSLNERDEALSILFGEGE